MRKPAEGEKKAGKLPQLHFIRRGDLAVVFHPDTFSVLKVDAATAEALERLSGGGDPVEIARSLGVSSGELAETYEGLLDRLSDLPEIPFDDSVAEGPVTLYLNVANACNLKCLYCYASGGSYNSPAGMMTKETAFAAIDRFSSLAKPLGPIVFFGGEPLMRAKLISEVCDYALEKAAQKKIRPPRFSVVTNGTLVTEEIAGTLARYRFSSTVSIDGPEAINDALRPANSGEGSHSRAAAGLRLLQAAGLSLNVEVTYTAEHMRRGVTPKDVLQYLQENFGTRTVTLSPVAAVPGVELSLKEFHDRFIPAYLEAARYSLESLNTDRPILIYFLRQILGPILNRRRRPQNQFCYTNLGREHLIVSAAGNVYPCHMMNDRAEFEMGKVSDPDVASQPRFKEVQEIFSSMEKSEMQCRTCWARFNCFICIAGVEIETGNLKPIPGHRCELVQGLTDESLLYVARIREDEAKWEQFVRNLLGIPKSP